MAFPQTAYWTSQVIENCKFFSRPDAVLSLIVAKEPRGGFKAIVLKTEDGQREALLSESACTLSEALQDLHVKSAEAVHNYITANGFEIVPILRKRDIKPHKVTKAVNNGEGGGDGANHGNDNDSAFSGSASSTVTMEAGLVCESLSGNEIVLVSSAHQTTQRRHHNRHHGDHTRRAASRNPPKATAPRGHNKKGWIPRPRSRSRSPSRSPSRSRASSLSSAEDYIGDRVNETIHNHYAPMRARKHANPSRGPPGVLYWTAPEPCPLPPSQLHKLGSSGVSENHPMPSINNSHSNSNDQHGPASKSAPSSSSYQPPTIASPSPSEAECSPQQHQQQHQRQHHPPPPLGGFMPRPHEQIHRLSNTNPGNAPYPQTPRDFSRLEQLQSLSPSAGSASTSASVLYQEHQFIYLFVRWRGHGQHLISEPVRNLIASGIEWLALAFVRSNILLNTTAFSNIPRFDGSRQFMREMRAFVRSVNTDGKEYDISGYMGDDLKRLVKSIVAGSKAVPTFVVDVESDSLKPQMNPHGQSLRGGNSSGGRLPVFRVTRPMSFMGAGAGMDMGMQDVSGGGGGGGGAGSGGRFQMQPATTASAAAHE
ncbi:hypothetical protein B0T17DRAFT_508589 [Bombardia bombarda]|uniref:Uncharacterized protein n=1 Tax=Bombardia bombarda TaxID=252184 RepID=A0AA39WTC4_9PEZI|nr:hypothetical protein B0T17DRAFT_508589 [Bombardia bombarda]